MDTIIQLIISLFVILFIWMIIMIISEHYLAKSGKTSMQSRLREITWTDRTMLKIDEGQWSHIVSYLNTRYDSCWGQRALSDIFGPDYFHYWPPLDLIIDMIAWEFIYPLLPADTDSWHYYGNTIEDISYYQTYAFKTWDVPQFPDDHPDYDSESDQWIWGAIEEILSDHGLGLNGGEGDPTDQFIISSDKPEGVITSMEVDGEYTEDQLYIDQLLGE